MERKSTIEFGSNPLNWQTSKNLGGTPKLKNSLFEPGPISEFLSEPQSEMNQNLTKNKSLDLYSGTIIINEIFPSVALGKRDENEEYVELFNQNSFEVDLSGWKIEDVAGITIYIIPQNTKIRPRGFLVFYCYFTKIILNNEKDGINLIHPNGKVIDSIVYEKALPGQSYNKISSNKWAWIFFNLGLENIN